MCPIRSHNLSSRSQNDIWPGSYHPPRRRSALPDPLIRGGLKTPWLAIDPSSLPAEARRAVDGWKAVYRDTMGERERLLGERKERSAVLSERRRVEFEERMERREGERKERMKVRILY